MATTDKATEPPKPLQYSKTAIVNLLIAVSAFIPPVQQFLSSHPESAVWGITALNVALRFVTKGRVTIGS